MHYCIQSDANGNKPCGCGVNLVGLLRTKFGKAKTVRQMGLAKQHGEAMTMILGALRGFGITLAVAAQAVIAAPAAQAENIHGTWENPTGDVRVVTQPCGTELCGKVSWASDLAKKDASDGGTPQLVGTSLLRNYRETKPGHWRGNVFVPDLGETYYSTIKQLDAQRIKISGCILGGLLCKSQIWRRM